MDPAPGNDATNRGRKRPKVKGCYECSRRRIDCDRREPTCLKCEQRGINCSGLGIRYRFNDGVASRGKLVGKQVPAGKLSYVKDASKDENQLPARNDENGKGEEDAMMVMISTLASRMEVKKGLDHLNGATRYLLHYFSEQVAPRIAVVNHGFNGFRDLILPLAEVDSLVRQAVLSVSTQHISSRFGECHIPVTDTYSNLIQSLVAQSQRMQPSRDHSSRIALLLLHIREMVSGTDDFKLIYACLRSLVKATSSETTPDARNPELDDFIKLQIFRIQLFAEALFDEAFGAQYLLTHQEGCLEFLRFCSRLHPEHKDLVSHLYELISLACTIYVKRATENPPAHETEPLVERCRLLTEAMDGYSEIMGHYLLGWSYFILAAESSTTQHREFWIERMKTLHRNTESQNILRAMEQAQRMWAVQGRVRWTTLLGGPTQALIM